jgi:hypothetical protein
MGKVVGVTAILLMAAPAMADNQIDGAMKKLAQGMTGMSDQMKEWLRLYTEKPKTFDNVTRPGNGPNSVTISATAPLLNLQETAQLVMARYPERTQANPNPEQWGKRGDVAVYFPQGVRIGEHRIYYLTGKQAEKYIKAGNELRGFANVGMPVEGYGSAMMAKNVTTMNSHLAEIMLQGSPVIKKALAKIARAAQGDAELAQAALSKEALTNSKVVEALHARAQKDPKVAKVLEAYAMEISKPVAFIVHGFGGNDKHHYQHKFIANKRAKPSDDKVVAGKAADLLASWWTAQKDAVMAGKKVRLFTANHCAGTYENADWTFHLQAKLNKQDPALAKKVMRRMYALDLGATANRPDGVWHRAYLGTSDTFGFMVSRSRGFENTTMVPGKGHMLNPMVHNHSPEELSGKALPIPPFGVAFPHLAAEMARDFGYDLADRKTRIAQHGARYTTEAEQARAAVKALKTDVPEFERVWVPFKLAKATALANQAVAEAQVARASLTETWRGLHEQLKAARKAKDEAKIAELAPKVKAARKAATHARNGLSSRSQSLDLNPIGSAIAEALHTPSYWRVGSGETTAWGWVSSVNPLTAEWELKGDTHTVADAKRLHKNAVEFARKHRKTLSNDLQYGFKGKFASLEKLIEAKYGKEAAPAKLAEAKAGQERGSKILAAQVQNFYFGQMLPNHEMIPGVMVMERTMAKQNGYPDPYPDLFKATTQKPEPLRAQGAEVRKPRQPRRAPLPRRGGALGGGHRRGPH